MAAALLSTLFFGSLFRLTLEEESGVRNVPNPGAKSLAAWPAGLPPSLAQTLSYQNSL